jgi:hypothetical protein
MAILEIDASFERAHGRGAARRTARTWTDAGRGRSAAPALLTNPLAERDEAASGPVSNSNGRSPVRSS